MPAADTCLGLPGFADQRLVGGFGDELSAAELSQLGCDVRMHGVLLGCVPALDLQPCRADAAAHPC